MLTNTDSYSGNNCCKQTVVVIKITTTNKGKQTLPTKHKHLQSSDLHESPSVVA